MQVIGRKLEDDSHKQKGSNIAKCVGELLDQV